METLRNYLENRKPLEIFFPPDEIESWDNLKRRYNQGGYYWTDFTLEPFLSVAKRCDKKNIKKYKKLKKNELKLRRSFRGTRNIIVVHPPPKPSNEERYWKLKKWCENSYYNITMITIYLFTVHNLKPCRDYEPDNLLDTYNRYSSINNKIIAVPPQNIIRRESYENNIIRQNWVHPISFPTPPPPVAPQNLKPTAPSAPLDPPDYEENSTI